MPKVSKSKHCWSPDIKQHSKCKFGMCQCPCHRIGRRAKQPEKETQGK